MKRLTAGQRSKNKGSKCSVLNGLFLSTPSPRLRLHGPEGRKNTRPRE